MRAIFLVLTPSLFNSNRMVGFDVAPSKTTRLWGDSVRAANAYSHCILLFVSYYVQDSKIYWNVYPFVSKLFKWLESSRGKKVKKAAIRRVL